MARCWRTGAYSNAVPIIHHIHQVSPIKRRTELGKSVWSAFNERFAKHVIYPRRQGKESVYDGNPDVLVLRLGQYCRAPECAADEDGLVGPPLPVAIVSHGVDDLPHR